MHRWKEGEGKRVAYLKLNFWEIRELMQANMHLLTRDKCKRECIERKEDKSMALLVNTVSQLQDSIIFTVVG